MGRSGKPGQGGGRGSGKGGRGKGGWNKKKNSNSDKKETTNKKFLFTLLQSTVDVRVSAYETTLKKIYQQLMKDIKTHPEDVIDSLKSEKKKDVKNHEKIFPVLYHCCNLEGFLVISQHRKSIEQREIKGNSRV